MAPDGSSRRGMPIIYSSPAAMGTMNGQHNFDSNNNNYDDLNPTVQGQTYCGTPEILESPHVREGPGRIMNAPVPSVFNDDRGSIHRLRVGGKRINMSHSEPGIMRSGHMYPVRTYVFVVSGTVEVWILQKTGTKKVVYSADDSFEIPPYTPHILNFLSRCVLNEWWEQHKDPQCWIFQPYRNIVDVQNAMVSNSTCGNHQLLIPQNDYEREQILLMTSSSSSVSSFLTASWYVSIGITIGTLLGFALSSSPSHKARR